jgi:hypothetical protein
MGDGKPAVELTDAVVEALLWARVKAHDLVKISEPVEAVGSKLAWVIQQSDARPVDQRPPAVVAGKASP